jgi:hypothetical protein
MPRARAAKGARIDAPRLHASGTAAQTPIVADVLARPVPQVQRAAGAEPALRADGTAGQGRLL